MRTAGADGVAAGRLRPSPRLSLTPVVLLGLVVAAPVLSVLAHLGRQDDGLLRHLAATVLWEYIANSLWLCAGVGILTGSVGAGCAWLVTMYRFPGRRIFAWALLLPLAMPAYVLAYAYTDFLQVTGPLQSWLRQVTGLGVRDYWFPEIRSLGGAVFVLSMALYPYVYALARAAFVEQSQCALEVSRTLGCTGFGAFHRVGLPLARPAVAAGISFVLMETLADFGAVSYFGIPTFTTGIYRAWYALGSPVAAAQLSSLLLLAVLGVLLGERALRGRARFTASTTHIFRKTLPRLDGLRGMAAAGLCFLPVLFGFLLPAGVLVTMAIDSLETPPTERLLALAANTVSLGVLAALLLGATALTTLFTVRRDHTGLGRQLVRLATLGYAVPGAVIGVGILLVIGAVDHAMAELVGGRGLVLGGTIVALLYGYLVRFFAVAYGPLEAGLTKIGNNLEDAARLLGAGAFGVFARVQVPLLRPALTSAMLLVFVDVMKELPATMILRPFNFDTLAVEAFRLATTERLDGAALPSLFIVVAGLVPVILLVRMGERRRHTTV
ncbi:Sulfate transport system permease protein CysW [bacterium HR40]|nr:Sulfate transport system permease protein CysW [bacterium HR40]